MIYKPAVLDPDRATISVGNTLTLTAHVQTGAALELVNESGTSTPIVKTDDNGDEYNICYATLILRINNRDYVLPFDENTFRAEMSADNPAMRSVYGKLYREKHSLKVQFDLDLADGVRYYGRCLYSKYLSVRESYVYNKDTNPILSGLIRSEGEYAWKVRLFAKGTINGTSKGCIDIGYGSIGDLEDKYSTNKADSTDILEMTINPHTNIYMDVMGNGYQNLWNEHEQKNITINNILKYQDENARYYISISGRQYPIKDYLLRQAPKTLRSNGNDVISGNSSGAGNFDGYGNPIHGYVYVEKTDALNIDRGVGAVAIDCSYKITCNYIDSMYAYFDIEPEPIITITNSLGEELNDTSYDEPYIMPYANLTLNAAYTQDSNIDMNYYCYRVYRYDNTINEMVLEYTSGNRFNQDIAIYYDKFFNGNMYMIQLSIVDAAQRVHERSVYIKAQYSNELELPQYASAEYYPEHNSIIVDWGSGTPVNPNVTGVYSYVNISNCELSKQLSPNAVRLYKGTVITYNGDDFGNQLNYGKNATLAVRFKGTASTYGTFIRYMAGGFHATAEYNGRAVVVKTSSGTYTFSIYPNYTQSQVKSALKSKDRDTSVPYVYNNIVQDIVWDEDTYYLHTENRLEDGEWILMINRLRCSLIRILSNGSRIIYTPTKTADAYMTYASQSWLQFRNDIIIDNMTVTDTLNDDIVDKFERNDWNMSADSVLFADYAGTLDGTNAFVDFRNVVGFRVFKTLGEDSSLHEVGMITNLDYMALEDFAVGHGCKYTYYIYPLVRYNDDLYYVSSPLKTNSVMIDDAKDSVFGLIPVDEDNKIYAVDPDTVWVFGLEMDDGGWTINNDKTFYDTLATYNQESIGNRAYVTKSVSALLGKVDCSTSGEYAESYDMLVTWMKFAKTPQLKCFVDLRGLILPGNFEANVSGEYIKAGSFPCITKFTWRQKADLDIISIHGIPLPYNPLKNTYLMSNDYYSMQSNDDYMLYGSI